MTTTPSHRPERPALGTLVQLRDIDPGHAARIRPRGARELEWCECTHRELGWPVFVRADGRCVRLPPSTNLEDWVRMLPVKPSAARADRQRACTALDANFPGCSFHVTSAQGGIEIYWTDGPPERAVAVMLVEEHITTLWLQRTVSSKLRAVQVVQLVLHGDWTGDVRDLWHMPDVDDLSEDVRRLGAQLAAFAGQDSSHGLYETMQRIGIGALADTCGLPHLAPYGTCARCPGPAAFSARVLTRSTTDKVCRRCLPRYIGSEREVVPLGH